MRQPKLSGREIAVLRATGFSEPTPGPEIVEISHVAEDDVIDVLNGLLDLGYVECIPHRLNIDAETFRTSLFEVNPSYAQQLRELIARRF